VTDGQRDGRTGGQGVTRPTGRPDNEAQKMFANVLFSF